MAAPMMIQIKTAIYRYTHKSFWLVRTWGCFLDEASEDVPIILSCRRMLPFLGRSDTCLVDVESLLVIVTGGTSVVEQLRIEFANYARWESPESLRRRLKHI